MSGPSRKTLLANAACLLLLLWLYGGDVSDALRAQSAEVAAFLEPPSLWRPVGVLLLTAAALGVGVWGLLRRRGDDFKGYRLLPLVLAGALFVDLVLSERRVPVGSSDLASMALKYFHGQVQQQATEDGVPADPSLLRPLLDQLGPPPYLVRGQPVREYTLQVRENCEGPVRFAPGLQPGTFLYCVAPGRQGAWITLVGLPAERRFGSPEVLSAQGQVRFLLVQALAAPAEAPTSQGESPFRDRSPPATEPGPSP